MIYVLQHFTNDTFTTYIIEYIVLLQDTCYTPWTLSMCCNICTVFFACVGKENKNDLKIKKMFL